MSVEIDTRPPADYLTDQPTEDERRLGRQVDLHDGAAVPFWMFAKVVIRGHQAVVWVASANRWGTWLRRGVIAVLTIGATNIGTFAYGCSNRLQAQAAAAEQAAEMRREIDLLESHVWQLRNMGSTDPRPKPGAPLGQPPPGQGSPGSPALLTPSVLGAQPIDVLGFVGQGYTSCRQFVQLQSPSR